MRKEISTRKIVGMLIVIVISTFVGTIMQPRVKYQEKLDGTVCTVCYESADTKVSPDKNSDVIRTFQMGDDIRLTGRTSRLMCSGSNLWYETDYGWIPEDVVIIK